MLLLENRVVLLYAIMENIIILEDFLIPLCPRRCKTVLTDTLEILKLLVLCKWLFFLSFNNFSRYVCTCVAFIFHKVTLTYTLSFQNQIVGLFNLFRFFQFYF